MNFKEFGILADSIKTYFPRDNILPRPNAMELWYDALKDISYQNASIALKKHIMTNKFPPTIADIRGNAVELNPDIQFQEINEMAAWGLVLKAMRNSIYHSEEEFAKLPPLVQKAVVSPAQLREWAMAEDIDGTWMNVTQSNFMRTYRAEMTRDREMKKLSPDILRLMVDSSDKISAHHTYQKSISVSEERKLAEQNSVPMPERLKKWLSQFHRL